MSNINMCVCWKNSKQVQNHLQSYLYILEKHFFVFCSQMETNRDSIQIRHSLGNFPRIGLYFTFYLCSGVMFCVRLTPRRSSGPAQLIEGVWVPLAFHDCRLLRATPTKLYDTEFSISRGNLGVTPTEFGRWAWNLGVNEPAVATLISGLIRCRTYRTLF